MKRFYATALKKVSIKEICAADPVSFQEMADFCDLYAEQLEKRIPLTKALDGVGRQVQHPWLVMLLSMTLDGVVDGVSLSQGVLLGIQELVVNRVLLLSNALTEMAESAQNVSPKRISRQVGVYDSDDSTPLFTIPMPEFDVPFGQDNPFHMKDWVIPDFLSPFALLFHMDELGHETGHLDVLLRRASDLYRSGGEFVPVTVQCSSETYLFLYSLGSLLRVEIPTWRVFRFLEELPLHAGLRGDITAVREAVSNGAELAEGFSKCQGELSSPEIVRLFQSGRRLELIGKDLMDLR